MNKKKNIIVSNHPPWTDAHLASHLTRTALKPLQGDIFLIVSQLCHDPNHTHKQNTRGTGKDETMFNQSTPSNSRFNRLSSFGTCRDEAPQCTISPIRSCYEEACRPLQLIHAIIIDTYTPPRLTYLVEDSSAVLRMPRCHHQQSPLQLVHLFN